MGNKKSYTKHGLSKKFIPEYRAWQSMKNRCYNNKTSSYKIYGGRGIIVCDRWLNSFENFLEDMGERPSDYHSVDRIDVDGNYCNKNCKWSTKFEQNNNQRRTKRLTYNGETRSIGEWAKHLNISYPLISIRLKKGMPIELILCERNMSVKYNYTDSQLIDLMAKGIKIAEIAKILNAGYDSVCNRIHNIRNKNPNLIPMRRCKK